MLLKFVLLMVISFRLRCSNACVFVLTLSYKRKSLKLVVSVKIVIYESVKLFGKNILEKTEMTRVDSYYGHVGVVELVDGVEKSAVAAYADEQFGIVIVVASDRKSFICAEIGRASCRERV